MLMKLLINNIFKVSKGKWKETELKGMNEKSPWEEDLFTVWASAKIFS